MTLQKTIKTSSALCALLSIAAFFLGTPAWIAGLWIGAAWGILNGFVLSKMADIFFTQSDKKFGWKLALLVLAKFAGLYGLAAWLLIGLRVPPVAWLIGFTVSLIAFTFTYKRMAL